MEPASCHPVASRVGVRAVAVGPACSAVTLSDMPLQLSVPPQGHPCRVEARIRRRACS
jgi:hypothetical protein